MINYKQQALMLQYHAICNVVKMHIAPDLDITPGEIVSFNAIQRAWIRAEFNERKRKERPTDIKADLAVIYGLTESNIRNMVYDKERK